MDADSRILRAGAAGHFLIRSGWSPSGPCRCPACAGPVPCGHVLRIPPRRRGRPGRLQPGAHRGQRGGAEPLPYRRAVCRRHGPHGQDRLRHRRPRAPPQPRNRAGGRGLPALRAAIPGHRAHARQPGRYLARLQRMGPATRQAPLRCHATRLAHREPGSQQPEIRGSARKAAPRAYWRLQPEKLPARAEWHGVAGNQGNTPCTRLGMRRLRSSRGGEGARNSLFGATRSS